MEQPNPIPNDSTPVWELVLQTVTDPDVRADMVARDQLGRARYGVPLQAYNGRGALQDAYEEALDLAVYLRQAIEEGDDVNDAYCTALELLPALRRLL